MKHVFPMSVVTGLVTCLLASLALSGTPLPPYSMQRLMARTGSGSLLAGDAYGTLVTNTGAGGAIELELPAAVVGMHFSACTVAAFAISLDPNGTDAIAPQVIGTLAAGDKITSPATAGGCVRLVAISAGVWAMFGVAGTWTDGGP